MFEANDGGNALTSRTARFAQFLRAAVAVKTKRITDVSSYQALWFSKLPTASDHVRSPLLASTWDEDDTRWLIVDKVQEPALPDPPKACAPWLEAVEMGTPDREPALLASCTRTNERGEDVKMPPDGPVLAAWARYLDQTWRPWALRTLAAREVWPVYQHLFAAYQELQGREDAYDLFVGVGLLHSRVDPGEPFRRHLVAFPAELSFDRKSGRLTLSPAAEFERPRVELDFVPSTTRTALQAGVDALQESLTEIGPSVHHRTEVGNILRSLVHTIGPAATYADDLQPADARPGQVCASFGPALILRPRNARSLDALLERIESDALASPPRVAGATIPSPWRRLIEDGREWDSGGDSPRRPPAEPTRIFFPLPSNDEQLKIIRHANGTAGVVVQGPPGTGKTHTIANLISHYLATGQRVLVTAQTAQALMVLRDKLPTELQALCVSLLGSGTTDDELQRSVKGILHRQQDYDASAYDARVRSVEHALLESQTVLARHERLLHDARVAETTIVAPVAGYRDTRAGIARQLADERAQHGWIEDAVDVDAACPAYAHGWDALARYHASFDVSLRKRLGKVLVDLAFEPAGARAVLSRINQLAASLPPVATATGAPPVPPLLQTADLAAVSDWLATLVEAESLVPAGDAGWVAVLRTALLGNDLAAWEARRVEVQNTVGSLEDELVASTKPVAVDERTSGEALRDLSRLSAHYKNGGRRRVAFWFTPHVVKETGWVEHAVKLDGVPVRSAEEVTAAMRALEGWKRLEKAWDVWTDWPPVRKDSARQQAALLRQRAATLDAVLHCRKGLHLLTSAVRGWLSEAAGKGCQTHELVSLVMRRHAELLLQEARGQRDVFCASLAALIGQPDISAVLPPIATALAAEDLSALDHALGALDAERTVRALHVHYDAFLSSIRASAPQLASALAVDEGTDRWGSRFQQFEAAWSHRRASSWLADVLSSEAVESADRAARSERQRIQDLMVQVTSARAWSAALARIDQQKRSALVAWSDAVSHIPKSGKTLFRRRTTARKYLGDCLGAIPAWVVSLGRLYDTIDASPGMFDVAIVDEASQCWLDALVLFYVAKQIIVVGDDKQISPTVVGVDPGEVDRLADAYLKDLKYRGSFTLESSLFDHARRYLPGGVPLREHFRCVPEIIRFSNELCYADSSLIPLRQVGKDRLKPIKSTYLPDGQRTGDINDVEARAIVDAIAAAHVNPEYEDSDFGVICLQGDAQAARIQQLLLDRLGPGIFARRQLRCGNPYAFQGDERAVIFLSMVAAPNANNAPLTKRLFEQRFNVAMSRARDQMWLFHSVREHDVSPSCLRRRVLEFFAHDGQSLLHGTTLDAPRLQVVAAHANRRHERPPLPFDSWFEVDVALALVAHGYEVTAQVQVASRRIDLVVEGECNTRLAVECDGDFWHGPEKFMEDLFRQRQLERANWRFVRVRESLFRSDRAVPLRK